MTCLLCKDKPKSERCPDVDIMISDNGVLSIPKSGQILKTCIAKKQMEFSDRIKLCTG